MVFMHVISRNNHCVKKSAKQFQKVLNFRKKKKKTHMPLKLYQIYLIAFDL